MGDLPRIRLFNDIQTLYPSDTSQSITVILFSYLSESNFRPCSENIRTTLSNSLRRIEMRFDNAQSGQSSCNWVDILPHALVNILPQPHLNNIGVVFDTNSDDNNSVLLLLFLKNVRTLSIT